MKARITIEVEIASDKLDAVITQIVASLGTPGHPVVPYSARAVKAEIEREAAS